MRIGSGIEPFRIDAVEPVLHANLFGRGDFDGRKINPEVSGSWRQYYFAGSVFSLSADSYIR
jgi:hypothetical protein